MSKNEWHEAELNYRKALDLIDKSLSGEHSEIIPFYLSVGKFKKAHKLLEKMRRNDPINQGFLAWYYFTYVLLGDRQKAEEEYQNRNKGMTPGDSDAADDSITFVRLGSGDSLSRNEIVSSYPIYIPGKEHLDSPEEGLLELRRIYSSDDNLSSYDLSRISIWAAYFGDPEFSLDALERGSGISSDLIPCWFPVMKEVRQLPRFRQFIGEIGLVDYWREFGWADLCHPAGDDDFVCD